MEHVEATFLRSLIANIPASVQTLRISAPVERKTNRKENVKRTNMRIYTVYS